MKEDESEIERKMITKGDGIKMKVTKTKIRSENVRKQK